MDRYLNIRIRGDVSEMQEKKLNKSVANIELYKLVVWVENNQATML